MLSERSLRNNDPQLYDDPQSIQRGDVTGNLIKMGVIGATSMGMYRAGLLRPVMKSLFEIGSKISQEGMEKAGTVMHSIKKWSFLQEVSADELQSMANGRYARPSAPSIFRERDSSLMYDLMMDAKDLINDGNTNFSRVRRIMRGSEEDLKVLSSMISEDLSGIGIRERNYKDTTLGRRLNELNYNIRNLSEKSDAIDRQSQMAFNNLGIRTIFDKMSMSDLEIQEELKRTGTRHLRIGDVAEVVKDENLGTILRMKENKTTRLNKSNTDFG